MTEPRYHTGDHVTIPHHGPNHRIPGTVLVAEPHRTGDETSEWAWTYHVKPAGYERPTRAVPEQDIELDTANPNRTD